MSSTLRAAAVVATVGVSLCSISCSSDEKPGPSASLDLCQAEDADVVQQLSLLVNGVRLASADEVNAYGDAYRGLVQLYGEADARRRMVGLMLDEKLYRQRWANTIMDILNVSRTSFVRDDNWSLIQSTECYQSPAEVPLVGPELAEYVRENVPSEDSPPVPQFELGLLMSSALALDDVSIPMRAQLFHMMSFPIPGANVSDDELERSRRNAFGTIFESAYLNRDPTCLPCHNSEESVTPLTAQLPGHFERAIYGDPTAAGDPLSFRSVFRTSDVISGTRAPWGWDRDLCGLYNPVSTVDPLGIETEFASIKSTADEPLKGKLASIWLLDFAIQRGVSEVRDGLEVGADGALQSPDEALAYLIAASFVGSVWEEVFGASLTIAHHFPRTAEQQAILKALTDSFVQSGFSLRKLLQEIAAQPVFSLAPATDSCWQSAYAVPPILDPFSLDNPNEQQSLNSPGDAVHPLSTRHLLQAVHHSLDWSPPNEFPADTYDQNWMRSVGLFLNSDDQGFRGFDFQARLAWEERYGKCFNNEPDFIDALIDRGLQSNSDLEDVVAALKDRLWAQPEISAEERPLVEDVIGASLSSTDLASAEEGVRLLCGALIVSPQYLLNGIGDNVSAQASPSLTPEKHRYAAVCKRLVAAGSANGLTISCGGTSLSVQ